MTLYEELVIPNRCRELKGQSDGASNKFNSGHMHHIHMRHV